MKDTNVEKLLETARQQDEKIRAGIKAKMIRDGVDRFTEISAIELAYLTRIDMGALVDEVNAELESRKEAGAAMQGIMCGAAGTAQRSRDPHVERVDSEREVTFEEVVKPLMRWMAENSCPHCHMLVSGTSAELFHGVKSFNTFEFGKMQAQRHEIRKADLSIAYMDNDCKWIVEETLYPESRGYIAHRFDTEAEANAFIAGAV